jgi:sugar-specific transcriptional regulator TrmB
MQKFSDENTKTLESLGLTLSQAKTYLNTLQFETASARTISRISKISQPDVYRIMHQLQELGLVERVITTPVKFKPIPIQDAIYILLERHAKETTELMVKARELVQNFKEKTAKTMPEDESPNFVFIPEKRAQLDQKITDMIETTQESICCSVPFKRFLEATTSFTGEIRKALKKGVEIRIVTDRTEGKAEQAYIRKISQAFKDYSSLEVRYSSTEIKNYFWIRDNKEMEIFTSPTYGQTYGRNATSALWSKDPSLLNLARDYFEMIWTRSLEGIRTKD